MVGSPEYPAATRSIQHSCHPIWSATHATSSLTTPQLWLPVSLIYASSADAAGPLAVFPGCSSPGVCCVHWKWVIDVSAVADLARWWSGAQSDNVEMRQVTKGSSLACILLHRSRLPAKVGSVVCRLQRRRCSRSIIELMCACARLQPVPVIFWCWPCSGGLAPPERCDNVSLCHSVQQLHVVTSMHQSMVWASQHCSSVSTRQLAAAV